MPPGMPLEKSSLIFISRSRRPLLNGDTVFFMWLLVVEGEGFQESRVWSAAASRVCDSASPRMRQAS